MVGAAGFEPATPARSSCASSFESACAGSCAGSCAASRDSRQIHDRSKTVPARALREEFGAAPAEIHGQSFLERDAAVAAQISLRDERPGAVEVLDAPLHHVGGHTTAPACRDPGHKALEGPILVVDMRNPKGASVTWDSRHSPITHEPGASPGRICAPVSAASGAGSSLALDGALTPKATVTRTASADRRRPDRTSMGDPSGELSQN
jgi:hypothetical protein